MSSWGSISFFWVNILSSLQSFLLRILNSLLFSVALLHSRLLIGLELELNLLLELVKLVLLSLRHAWVIDLLGFNSDQVGGLGQILLSLLLNIGTLSSAQSLAQLLKLFLGKIK